MKYAGITEFLDAYVTNIQNDLDRIKEQNGPSNIYDDKQTKLLKNHGITVVKATSLSSNLKTGI